MRSILERERFALPMMNALYTRCLYYIGLLMDVFLVGIVLFSARGVPPSVIAFFGYVVLAARAYLFLLGTIFKAFCSDRMLLYGMEFAGAGALAAAYGSRFVGVLLICVAFGFQLSNRSLSTEAT